jgi:polyhydroxyalkanoate synthesis regulator phasin
VDSASSLGGIPEKNIRRDINGIINLFKTLGRDMDTTYGSLMDKIGEDLKDSIPVWGWLPDEKKGDKLYDAIIKGDKAYEERLKNGYKSDSAYDSAIRKALRENDPRIKEAAEAKVNGDSAEANRIAEEIAREGHFSRENIKAAIKSEVNNLMPDDTSDETSTEDKDEAISYYDASDINVAFERGDTARAKEIIQDLIDTKVANGKTEKEAKSSLRSSMTSYWKPLYIAANESERIRIRKILYNSGLYGNADEVVKSVNAWLKD